MKPAQLSKAIVILFLFLISIPSSGQELHFNSSWESLEQYECPEWFRDAKFGIWTCWNAYTVPAAGDWYARNMYIPGHKHYKYHIENYGHPSEVGYKEILHMWKGENFDPESLVALFKESGAKYIAVLANHHDNFDLWDSKYHEWNSVNYGPKQDIVGKWKKAVKESGLHWAITTHLARSWCWFQTSHGADSDGEFAGIPYDGINPEFESLYHETHGNTSRVYPQDPPDHWKEEWYKRMKDLIDQHQPDLLYLDGGIPFGETGRKLLAYYYNENIRWNDGRLNAVMNIKNMKARAFHGDFRYGVAVEDVEIGQLEGISQLPWQTDNTIGDWFWTSNEKYNSPNMVIHQLIDIVSKNGNLLLDVPPRADGTLDNKAISLLKEIGEWLRVNGEGIYGTRPYSYFGEGPTLVKGGHFTRMTELTAEDFRFTTSGDIIYAFSCGQPENSVLIKAFSSKVYHKIKSVEMLGNAGELKFEQKQEGLEVRMPEKLPSDYAVCLKIIPILNPLPGSLKSK